MNCGIVTQVSGHIYNPRFGSGVNSSFPHYVDTDPAIGFKLLQVRAPPGPTASACDKITPTTHTHITHQHVHGHMYRYVIKYAVTRLPFRHSIQYASKRFRVITQEANNLNLGASIYGILLTVWLLFVILNLCSINTWVSKRFNALK